MNNLSSPFVKSYPPVKSVFCIFIKTFGTSFLFENAYGIELNGATASAVPITINKSVAISFSDLTASKNSTGRPSPKNTIAGLHGALQSEHLKTCPFLTCS